ncbi:chemotaxis protein [Paracidovorax avenae]|uniref:methyl-accepting chemotaxis protein n=1 Tax=Paracidovorax avenae TaxID=80867 RepID=UPI000D175FE9|nr:methyl-accepting chemotaxis protein [Paracidovorax avenae]AVS87397.1 chemotaxis protein [Paracidovorax avenae]
MNTLGRLSIRTRLYFGTIFSLVLLVVIGGLGYLALDRTRDTLQVLFSQRVQTLTDMADLRTTLGTLRRTEKDIILNFNNSVEVASQREAWGKTLAALRKSLTAVRQVQAGDAAFVGSIDKALAEIQQYEAGISPIFEQIERAQLDGAGGAAYADRLKSHMEATDQILASLAQSARENMEEARQGVEARTATMSAVIGGGLVLALAVLIPLTFFSVRSITSSLAQARLLAERIASGDLSHEVRPAQMDEVGQLVVAMGRMQEALRGLVRQVQEASGNISTASTEIASGNHDLSQRTEQTAANLEETASSMEMLAGTVQQSTQSARQASDFASTAAQVAARGGTVVSQVVDTMGQITDSSRRIADITGVIDSIAFQTNILALNAAVEAARAGEQGRGFAVVAAEVRTLAQRSASAAKEIKELIGSSVERVESGSRLVGQAGATMTEIVDSVRRVSEMISEITASSAEQSDNIGQISQSVSQLDQMTQQNAALVEQSTAASESLRDQAVQLIGAVRRFRLDDDGTVVEPALQAPPPPGSAPLVPRPQAAALPEPVRGPVAGFVRHEPAA